MNAVWKKHGTLAWSNPGADDATRIRAALLRPRFSRVLDIAAAFGLERVRSEWSALESHGGRDVERARAPVERILRNINEGFDRAARRN